ncbi:MAG: trehalase-like domain-containing protein, partial [Actinomycetota bacterium]
MSQPAIGDHALIGDTRTAALVSAQGAIDWMCAPKFDASPLFGRLVDRHAGGSFSLGLTQTRETRRRYLPGSAVVRTDVTTSTGTAHVLDSMIANVRGTLLPQNLLVRRVRCDSGEVEVTLTFDPRWGLPGRPPERVRQIRGRGAICEWGSLAVSIASDPDLSIEPGRPKQTRLRAGET